MKTRPSHLSRRDFLTATTLAGGGLILPAGGAADASKPVAAPAAQALVAISLDLEMAANFPRWEDTHWNYEKGNLDLATKNYAVEAARRIKAQGGVAHFFVVGRVFEQENVDWLKELVRAGHAVGNHTYDHVNLLATKPAELQFRFQRAPWLIEGRSVPEVLRENIRLTTAAIQQRLGLAPSGFRTPGGFPDGLAHRADLQALLVDLGFKWVSSKYPAHPNTRPGLTPTPEVYDGIVRAQIAAQPFAYPGGLMEIPMSPISDISAFRGGRWQLEYFLEAIRRAVTWAIENRAVFDFLAHPACLSTMDPEFRAIELICHLVRQAGDRAALVNLETIARRIQA